MGTETEIRPAVRVHQPRRKAAVEDSNDYHVAGLLAAVKPQRGSKVSLHTRVDPSGDRHELLWHRPALEQLRGDCQQ